MAELTPTDQNMDLEANNVINKPTADISKRGTAFTEAAALLTLWSVLVINEGGIRLVSSNPSVDLFASGRPPAFVVFLGGVFEVAFGLFGLLLGMAAFLYRWHKVNVTKAAMVTQTILGYYVFIVFVFLIPAFGAADLTEPMLPGLTVGSSRIIITMGILTSFHFCLALQGGQFIFFARLVGTATGTDFLKQHSGYTMRAFFWNGNMGLAGLWTTITGAIVLANVGSGTLVAPFVSPPNVGRLPGFTVFTGILMMIWALLGMGITAAKIKVPVGYSLGSAFVYLIAILNYAFLQFALLEPNGGAVALHAGLAFMVVFLANYFVLLAGRERDGEMEF